jgi:hypothetical protein
MATLDVPTIRNIGNAQIDATISGTDLTSGSNTITVGNAQYQFTALGYHALTTGTQTELGLNLAKGSSSTTNVDFRLTIPIGTVAGSYSGTTEIIAIEDTSDPLGGLGTPCALGSQCSSGNCIDTVCCSTTCTGICQSCNGAYTGGSSGTCGFILNLDPDNECSGAQVCNGAGACI